MAITLYDISVANYLQALNAVGGYLDKGLSHCRDNGIDPEEIVGTSFFPDMQPFRFQIQSVAHHSLGAIEAIRKSVFYPPSNLPEHGYAELQTLIANTRETLQKLAPEEINGLEGADVIFHIGEAKLPFTAAGFLLSFSLPNFYFHATTAYDILRSRGVPVGKRDYLGKMRLKK